MIYVQYQLKRLAEPPTALPLLLFFFFFGVIYYTVTGANPLRTQPLTMPFQGHPEMQRGYSGFYRQNLHSPNLNYLGCSSCADVLPTFQGMLFALEVLLKIFFPTFKN